MKLEQTFAVEAPLAVVWEALTDAERVAPCLPGAQVSAGAEPGVYEGTFTVKLGPTTASYQGSLRMESLDESAHVATMRAEGRDRRGQGGAKATIRSEMREESGGTRVDVLTDFTITGRLARFGRGGMIEDISGRLLEQFSQCLQDRLAGSGGAAPRVAEDATVPPAPSGAGDIAGETAAVEVNAPAAESAAAEGADPVPPAPLPPPPDESPEPALPPAADTPPPIPADA